MVQGSKCASRLNFSRASSSRGDSYRLAVSLIAVLGQVDIDGILQDQFVKVSMRLIIWVNTKDQIDQSAHKILLSYTVNVLSTDNLFPRLVRLHGH